MSVQSVDWLAIAPVALTCATALAVLLLQALLPARANPAGPDRATSRPAPATAALSATRTTGGPSPAETGSILPGTLDGARPGRGIDPHERRGRNRLLDGVTLAGLALAAISLLPALRAAPTQTFCTAGGCSFASGGVLTGLQLITLVAAAVIVLLAVEDPVVAESSLSRHEFWVLLLAATAGTLAVIASRDLLTLVVALETASLPVIGLVGAARTPTAALAATRLLMVSVASFGLTLLGVALLYAATGTVYLDAMRAGGTGATTATPVVSLLAVSLIVVGVGYKVAALPFGLWAPDVYPATSLPVATYLSTVSKVAGVAAAALVVVKVVPDWATGPDGLGAGDGLAWLAVLAGVTMTLANIVALTRRGVLALLAWSTIAQAGWALLPLTAPGAREVLLGAVGTYLIAYVAASLAVFAVVVLVSRHHRAGQLHTIDDEAGLLRTEPVAAVVLVLGLFSLAGLPPGVAGLVAKVVALRPVVEGAGPLGSGAIGWVIAVVAAVNVAIALAYYLRWIWIVVNASEHPAPTWRVRLGEGSALCLAAAILIVITILPGVML
ncbi:MAG: NADH-quinone oxidoreductase subunit N [Actinomycetales bacterium]